MSIKVGDFVLVPKGTTVWDKDSLGPGVPSKRDQTVEVRELVNANGLQGGQLSWMFLLPEADQIDPDKAARYGTNKLIWSTRYSNDQLREDRALRERLHARMVEVSGTTDFTLVEWSTKRALLAHVKPVAAPKKKERVVTVQQKMVKNSRWRFPVDTELKALKDNPNWRKGVDAFWKQHPNPPKHLGLKPGNGTFTDVYDYLRHHNIPQYVEYTYATIKAGQEFKVTGKMRKSYPDNGLLVPARLDGATKDSNLALNSIKDVVEELEVPVVRVFVLRDRDTGEVFADWRDRWWEQAHNGTANAPTYTTDWRKMRKFDDMGRLKQFVLEFSGYYKDMAINEGRDYWQEPSQTKIMDLPPNWEAVAYDKLVKSEIEPVDIQQWYAQAWRLRTLTINFGSPVRTLYKTLENKNELGKYKGMLVIRMPQEEGYRGAQQYTDEAELEDLAAIDDLIDSLGLKRGEFRKTKDKYGAAVTFETPAQALLAKLKYTGNMRLNVINLDKMQEELSS